MTDPRNLLKDAGYVAVGLGVIAFQRGQVRRRELEKQLAATDLEARIEMIVAEVRGRLPEQALDAYDTAIGAAKDATGQLLDLVRPATAA